MRSKNDSRRKGHCQPLMWVDCDGIRKLDPSNQVAMPIAENSRSAVSPIDVHPNAMFATNLRNCDQDVNSSGVRGSRRSYYAEWDCAGSCILVDSPFELLNINLNPLRYGNPADPLTTQTEKTRRFIQRMVGFGRGVYDGRPFQGTHTVIHHVRKFRGESQRQRRKICLVATACERAAE